VGHTAWYVRWTAFAAACIPLTMSGVTELAGFTINPTTEALGTNSHSSSNRFSAITVVSRLMPVKFRPGRLKLSTRPTLTGSVPITNKIGMVRRSLSRKGRRSSARRHNDRDRFVDKLRRQFR
jgi:hypothetical protein